MKFKYILISLFLLVNTLVATTVGIEFKDTKPNGDSWDVLGGKPDIYIVVNGHSYRNNRCKNLLKCNIKIEEPVDTELTIEVWDADVAKDDYAGEIKMSAGNSYNQESFKIYMNEFDSIEDDLDNR